MICDAHVHVGYFPRKGKERDLIEANSRGGKRIAPIERFKRRVGVVGDAGEVIADGLAGHDLDVTAFRDAAKRRAGGVGLV